MTRGNSKADKAKNGYGGSGIGGQKQSKLNFEKSGNQ
jgi:hypothetical protein